MAALENKEVFINKETIKRLALDVKDIINNPLENEGIYYIHDEDDILKGRALIIGPRDTPYELGFYLFTFKFPNDYPYSPPKISFHTNDGVTRFNPNLYRNGKVCISILNTWKGPQWTSCQTIRSILLCICGSVLNEDPLLNEPGVTKNHRDYKNYLTIIKYKNYDTAIYGVLNNDSIQENYVEFYKIMVKEFIKNYDKIITKLEEDYIINQTLSVPLYKMHNVYINYDILRNKLEEYYKLIIKYKN
tara:strand:+ start:4887 stop:5627 length:741 start_codon:yes stop_codon:yes gene_type:complete